ncbi:NAD-dependent protein deacetylase sirtuin-2 isoform X2 [Prorops nasuta]
MEKKDNENKAKEPESEIEKLGTALLQKLGLNDRGRNEEPEHKILNELTLDGIIEYIQATGQRKIITMSGAGISTSAGIPDFRSPNSGIYDNLQKYNLPSPQAMFSLDYFKTNPEPFFNLAKELLPENFKPTKCHYFIRLLHEKGLLLRHYTQNIDTLEKLSGLPEDKIVEVHGTFEKGHCLKCREAYDLPWMKEKVFNDVIPKCEQCKEGVVKPDIVFFGEMLPERFLIMSNKDFKEADLLIVMGTRLEVLPFSNIIDWVKPTCPRLLINKELVGMRDDLSRVLGIKEGFVFKPKNAKEARDVAWLGDCDTGCKLMADKLGWGEELEELFVKEHERLDKEMPKTKDVSSKRPLDKDGIKK